MKQRIAQFLFSILLQSEAFKKHLDAKIEEKFNQLLAAMNDVAKIEAGLASAKNPKKADKNLFLFEEKGLKIRFEKHHITDYGYFHVSIPIDVEDHCSTKDFYFPNLQSSPTELGEATISTVAPFLKKIWETKIVTKVSFDRFQFNITKSAAESWVDIVPQLVNAIASCYPDIPEDTKKALQQVEVVRMQAEADMVTEKYDQKVTK